MNIQILFVEPFGHSFSQGSFVKILRRANPSLTLTTRVISPSLSLDNGWVSDATFFSLAKPAMNQGSIIVFITAQRIEGNWFVRRSDVDESTGEWIDASPVLIVSTKDVGALVADLPISFERVVAGLTMVALHTSTLLSRGANYFEIYSDPTAVEKSIFNFCADKEVLRHSLMAGTLGARIKSLMEKRGYSQVEIEAIESSFRYLTKDHWTKIERFGRDNPVRIAGLFLALGWMLSLLGTPSDLARIIIGTKTQKGQARQREGKEKISEGTTPDSGKEAVVHPE